MPPAVPHPAPRAEASPGISGPHPHDPLPERWLARVCLTLVLAGALYGGAVLWTGTAETWQALVAIGAPLFVGGTLLCTATLALRFARWRYLLGRLGHRLPPALDLRVYLAGTALSATPGKLGETVRSALLRPHGVAWRQSLAVFFTDRASDVLGVALLGALAGAIAGQRQPLLEALALGLLLAGVLAARWLRHGLPPADGSDRARDAAGGAGRLARAAALLAAPARVWAGLWRGPRPLLLAAVALGAYGLQAAVFAAYVDRLAPGLPLAGLVALFAAATLIGAASLLPAGLGAMDSALVLQLLGLGVPLPQAVAAALASRVSTLWVSWLIGLAALGSFAGPRLAAASPVRAAPQPAGQP